jgi:hypothetical protein
MHANHRAANPFAMMLDPEAVLAQVAHSERLSRLQRRVCRPLDKPMLGRAAGESTDLEAFDSAIDDTAEPEADDGRTSSGDTA